MLLTPAVRAIDLLLVINDSWFVEQSFLVKMICLLLANNYPRILWNQTAHYRVRKSTRVLIFHPSTLTNYRLFILMFLLYLLV
jgi:hypothetical protein